MDVFAKYKPLRNKISLLARDDALRVIWAYSQYLQIDDFKIPNDIEVIARLYSEPIPRRIVAEWELELLAKEIILNSSASNSKGRTLRQARVFSDILNTLRGLENEIYGAFGSPGSILVELIRIAHRQFIWQGNSPNAATTIRSFKIFNHPQIVEICLERFGLTVEEIFLCGMAFMGSFLSFPSIVTSYTSEIKKLPREKIAKFLTFTSRTLAELKVTLNAEQQYNANFAYAYNSLRAFPLVRMPFLNDGDAFVCPLPTLLFWKITGGLYYDLIDDPRFSNPFGESFQSYVGEVLQRAITNSAMRVLPEEEYGPKKARKRSVDWIIADEHSAIFLECKAKRLSWGAKSSLNDLTKLEADIDNMAAAVVQVYKTVADYQRGQYPNFPYQIQRKIYPVIVTFENWRMFGSIMFDRLASAITEKISDESLPNNMIETMPYAVLAIEELEIGGQIINIVGISDFLEGKLNDAEMRTWEWHGYMTKRFPNQFPARKLFDPDYEKLFANLD
jgi:hypothetical protein